jgi:hypothetical protein
MIHTGCTLGGSLDLGEGGGGKEGGRVSPAFSAKIDLSFLMLWVGAIPVSFAKLNIITEAPLTSFHIKNKS